MKATVQIDILHRCPGDENSLIPLATNAEQSNQWITEFETKGHRVWGNMICRYCGLQLKVEKFITGN